MSNSTPSYEAQVRHYHPKGYPAGYFAGCVKRNGGKRMTDICAHRHGTVDEARECADRLAAIRNARR